MSIGSTDSIIKRVNIKMTTPIQPLKQLNHPLPLEEILYRYTSWFTVSPFIHGQLTIQTQEWGSSLALLCNFHTN